jgi:hypothetical protein
MILAQALLPAPHKVGFEQGLKLSALILRESAIATHGQVLLDLELLSF